MALTVHPISYVARFYFETLNILAHVAQKYDSYKGST